MATVVSGPSTIKEVYFIYFLVAINLIAYARKSKELFPIPRKAFSNLTPDNTRIRKLKLAN